MNRRLIQLFLLLGLVLLLPTTAFGLAPLPQRVESPSPKSTVPAPDPSFRQLAQLGGTSQAIAYEADSFFISEGPALTTMSLSDSGIPAVESRTLLTGLIYDIEPVAPYVYVAEDAGLRVLDRNGEVGSFATADRALGVVVNGNHAYVAARNAGLYLLDISDPAHPQQLAQVNIIGGAWDVALSPNHANIVWVLNTVDGLTVLDLSDPSAPQEVGFCCMPSLGLVTAIQITNNRAYVTSRLSGPPGGSLHVLDVTNPANPVWLGKYTGLGGWPTDMQVSGNHAYVTVNGTSSSPALRIVDVSDPTQMTSVGTALADAWGEGVALAKGYVYVADALIGLRMLDISNPAAPQEVYTYQHPGAVVTLVTDGNYAYLTSRPAMPGPLLVVDVTDPSRPVMVPTTDSFYGNALALSGQYLYTSGGGSLHVYDVSDPTQPLQVAEHDLLPTSAMIVSGDYLYAVGNNGLIIKDISNLAQIRTLGSLSSVGMATMGLAIAGDYLYLADYASGLAVVDVSAPAHPQQVASLPGGAAGVDVAGNYAYVAAMASGLRVVDISNPTQPEQVGLLDTPGTAAAVQAVGRYAYLADADQGVRIINISDPTQPKELTAFDTPGSASTLAVVGNQVYVGDSNGGLVVLQIPTSPSAYCYIPLVHN